MPVWEDAACLVVMLTLARAHREESASPRKPKVSTEARSVNSRNLEVWCFKVSPAMLLSSTPDPLSVTLEELEKCQSYYCWHLNKCAAMLNKSDVNCGSAGVNAVLQQLLDGGGEGEHDLIQWWVRRVPPRISITNLP